MKENETPELIVLKQVVRNYRVKSITNRLIYMGSRVCDNCGKTKDTSGGKTCSRGHFLCHHCASYHQHCTVCGHTLR